MNKTEDRNHVLLYRSDEIAMPLVHGIFLPDQYGQGAENKTRT